MMITRTTATVLSSILLIAATTRSDLFAHGFTASVPSSSRHELFRRPSSPSPLQASSVPPTLEANLGVRLDRPVVSFSEPRASFFLARLLTGGGGLGVASVCFLAAFAAVVLASARATSSVVAADEVEEDEEEEATDVVNLDDDGPSRVTRVLSAVRERASDALSRVRRRLALSSSKPAVAGVPMDFPMEGGWGVCSLAGSTPVGDSDYVRYDFDLPRPDHELRLKMGQRLELCVLDDDGQVAKGGFYPYHHDQKNEQTTTTTTLGKVSIVAKTTDDGGDFARVLRSQLSVGDEVALRPGDDALSYRGPYLPVTDMVYVVAGDGVVPVVRQISAILPAGASAVRSVSVVWVNDDARDLDVAYDGLERLHAEHRRKLGVDCVIVSSDGTANSFSDPDGEIKGAVPDFRPGTMAVVAGPEGFSKGVREWLVSPRSDGGRDWPEDCVCVLP